VFAAILGGEPDHLGAALTRDPRVTTYRSYVANPTGQWMNDADDRRWWFESGALVIDFAYTGRVGDDAATSSRAVDAVDRPADLAAWIGDRVEQFDGSVGDHELRDALLFRDALARALLAASASRETEPADVDTINLFAATPDIPPSLPGGTRQAGRSSVRAGQVLSVLARQAVSLLDDANTERIRECDASDCTIVFYDESRSNNRRWCSMARCGNRAKVRKHRAAAHA
jgi:predicted RNA-binding Zn ribbon-like protein